MQSTHHNTPRVPRWLLGPLLAPVLSHPGGAAEPPRRPNIDPAGLLQALTGTTTDALAGSVRGYLVRCLPQPLYETRNGWGHTKECFAGVKWKGQGLHVHPVILRKPKNDGHWQHLRVEARNPTDTLIFDLRDLQSPGPGRLTFTTFLSCDVEAEREVQHWESGIRLSSRSARARFRIRATLHCEVSLQMKSGSTLLPDAVIRLRVTRSDVGYDNFVMEHVAGVGGEAARLIGEAARNGLRQWHPSLERELLARINAAIEKSADTHEVRVSLHDLATKHGWLPGAK